jgi:hypothetical protein
MAKKGTALQDKIIPGNYNWQTKKIIAETGSDCDTLF